MEKETHTNRGRGRIWYLLSLSPSLFPLGRWSSVFWVFRVFRLGLLDLSLEVCSSPRTWPGCRLGGPWVSFIPKGVLLRVHKPLLRVCLCKCTHDQCVGAVFPPPPSPELVAAVRPSPLSEGTLSSNVCDSLCLLPIPSLCPAWFLAARKLTALLLLHHHVSAWLLQHGPRSWPLPWRWPRL